MTTDFPHAMRIDVVEHKAVAALEVGDEQIAATGSGLLLRGVAVDSDLPTIRMDAPPAGERVTNANTRAALRIAAAAPDRLRERVLRLWTGPKGMMLALTDGPDLSSATASTPAASGSRRPACWPAPEAAGATYLDLRIPERVAAGGLGPVSTPTRRDPGTRPSYRTLNRRVRMTATLDLGSRICRFARHLAEASDSLTSGRNAP